MEKNASHLYEFGPFRLDPAERLLSRGEEPVPLTPKAFDLLVALVSQPGHLWEKDALLKTLWPDSFVEESNLADNVFRLRKALGDGDNGQKFIETVPKRGYRFTAQVIATAAESSNPDPERQGAERARAANWTRRRIGFTFGALLAVTLAGEIIRRNSRLSATAQADLLAVKGNFYLSRWSEDDIRKAIDLFNRAIELNPSSNAGYEGLAASWNFLSDLHVPPREAMPKYQTAILKALQLNENSSTAHVSLAVFKTQYEWDWAGAEKEFHRAIALDPDYDPAHQLYGWYLIAVGRPRDAQAQMTRTPKAVAVESFHLWCLGLSYYFARQYDQAIEQYRRAIGIEPKSHWPHMLLAWAYEQTGKFPDAITELQTASRLFDNNPQVVAALGHAYAASGQRDAAQKVIAELGETANRRYVSPYDVATVYAGLRDNEQALAWLERAYEHRTGWLAWWLKVDPKFDALNPDPRFRDLVKRIGL